MPTHPQSELAQRATGWLRRWLAGTPRRLTLCGLLWVLPPVVIGTSLPNLQAGDSFPFFPVRKSPVVQIYDRVKDAVVNIQSERTVQPTDDPFTLTQAPQRVNGMGTGIIIDPRGYIVTNHHVVDDVTLLRIRMADGTTYPSRVIARDAENDLALIKIDAPKPLPTMPIGTSSDLMRGEPVIAIGNAFGYEHTVSSGIISALKRDVTLNKEVSYKSLIQTDAAINPGNSGGPLLNVRGELIGVNVAIRAGAHGIAFAIPVDSMLKISAEMLARTRRTPLIHGMVTRDVVVPDGEQGPAKRHVVIDAVEPDSPAAKAGIQPGDILSRVYEQPITTTMDLERALLDRMGGEKMTFSVQRGQVQKPMELVLLGTTQPVATNPDIIWRKLGVRLQTVQPDGITKVNTQLRGGLSVVDVNPNSTAARAGFQRGDVLIGLHQWETLSPDNVTYVLTHPDLSTFTPLRFFIIRGGQVRRGWFQQLD
ncbi:trypsin-like peptidase domain-containing protein [Tuwongella immobilis]|uniref:PDZ domain-containing protein n=1 Tax=Tuwongella immobilis TaxID=692036 RepID=A0A6C2YS98_9BACT|nr:trypsin-like peptidase domain-containing protein [Tuwongella immobilis]VIP04029.1 serine protease : Periplasmic serine proteinase Do OS=Planctomyces maris DSM 8797 GN=PM8797T_30499 PE=4 SV=1: Trypsin_2: PDZ_2 [Tuwongella immobilis]VTS05425.1 serine protease : Periplasmic serine proteinase Do OS=Planctomyces maris DSM 8797 GN=PM8797T_30499 PE=4 SV=1: Trypsin_2: PDZ_2 [Tuwongella immobilis]